MPYFGVDDQFAFHPKALTAGNAAIGLWARAGSWCKAHATGGHVPREVADALGTPEEAAALVRARLWITVDDGYQFHDWTDTAGNGTAQEESERREQSRARNRERQRAWRERQRNAVTPDVTGSVTPPSRQPPVPDPLTTTPSRLTSVDVRDDEGEKAVDKSGEKRPRAQGVVDLEHLYGVFARVVEDIDAEGAETIAALILERQKRTRRTITDPTAYVERAFRRDPLEWEKRYYEARPRALENGNLF